MIYTEHKVQNIKHQQKGSNKRKMGQHTVERNHTSVLMNDKCIHV